MPDIRELLSTFDDIIVERGEAYYHEGRVTNLTEEAPGKYSATVEGSEEYEVFVSLEDAEYDCNCPYWNAPYCKHVAAVLLAIEAMQQMPSPAENEPSDTALDKLSHKELVTLLKDIQIAFPQTADWVKARLSPPKDAIQTYRRLIRRTADSYERNGLISYRDMADALCGVEAALSCLERMIASSDILHTLDFAMMILEETLAIMQDGDDSDGIAGGMIEACLDALERLLRQRILAESAEKRKTCFDRLITAADSPMLRDWDMWSDRLIEQCTRIADDLPELRERLLQRELRIIKSTENAGDYFHDYKQEQAQNSYYTLLLRWDRQEAAQAFAAAHTENDYFRVRFFESALRQEQYDRAIEICLAAEQACASHLVLCHEWRERRYDVYARVSDIDAQKQLAEEMLLEGYGEYYPRLKALYPAEAWPAKRKELLDQMSMCRFRAYLEIITMEKDKPRLMAYLRSNPSSVFSLYEHLLPDYCDEIVKTFRSVLHTYAAQAADRKGYQRVCSHIRIFEKACGKEMAIAIIRECQQAYPRRPAFQDELKKLLARY